MVQDQTTTLQSASEALQFDQMPTNNYHGEDNGHDNGCVYEHDDNNKQINKN